MSNAFAEERPLIVGVYENAPKIFTAPDGEPAGIFIDVIQQIAQSEGWRLQYRQGTFSEGLARLQRGEIDLMPDVALTAERERLYAFHKTPVLASWFQVYVRQDSDIRTVLDLQGKRIAVLQGSVQQETFKALASDFGVNLQMVVEDDYDAVFEAVLKAKADAAISNHFYGSKHARKRGLADTAIIFHPSDLFFAAPKNAPKSLLERIDADLTDMKSDTGSSYYRSLKKWTSAEVHFDLPTWLAVLGQAALLLLVLSFIGSLLLKRQVTRRTRQLQDAQQRFMDIVEFLPDATFVVDEEKRVIAWNRACETMTGVTKKEMLGHGAYAYAEPFFGERRPVLIDLLDHPAPEAESAYTFFQRGKDKLFAEFFVPSLHDGRGAHLWGVASPLYNKEGSRTGAIETLRDITEQKAMEEALRESEREYRELVMLANSIILRWSPEGRIIFLNEFGLRFFGYAEQEILGRHVIGTLVPENESTGRDLQPLMDEICADPFKFERNINENMCRDGRRVWIEWTNKVVWGENGSIKEILSIGLDITDRKEAEEKIRKLNLDLQRHAEILERRVEERTAELLVAKERAEAADRIKSAFLANMSHELRTPLNSIIGFTGIMLQQLAGPLNPEQQKQMTMVQNSSRHLLALINDVLDISKIEAGQLRLSREPFELAQSVRNVVKLVEPLAAKKNISLHVDLPKSNGMIDTDRRRLEQILLNLLNNAVKFTQKGEVRTSLWKESDGWCLSVSDTGIGMPPEELPLLFRPFHQIDTGLTRKYEGTGLGLSICKKLLDLMGGAIEVESRIGKGSTFTIRLPESSGDPKPSGEPT